MGEAATTRADLEGGGSSISLDNRHRYQWHVQFLSDDLLQHGIGISASVRRTGE
jgi:hypothetical protein